MGGNSSRTAKAEIVPKEDREKRHAIILKGYRVPSRDWHSITEEFVRESAFELIKSPKCLAIFTCESDQNNNVQISVMYNPRINIAPKNKFNAVTLQEIWKEFQRCGFVSVMCGEKDNVDEYCYRITPDHKYWFWHVDHSNPSKPSEPSLSLKSNSNPSEDISKPTDHVEVTRGRKRNSQTYEDVHPGSKRQRSHNNKKNNVPIISAQA